ncbi:hypothetical protein ACFSFY_16720 [Sporosarcina siberiensis]|uniref:PhoD-like phosphatase n=1 Tax=Sporosarcina siberiensis TaxID=1365606 RepID=A0ABW4SKY2_9BACL
MLFPKVLAGPILRRVDRQSVTIWIATSQSFEINARIFTLEQEIALDTISEVTSICTGEKLFIHLIQIHGRFPTDTLLGYNLFLQDINKIYDLKSLDLISENKMQSITYGDLPYPSFFIPDRSNSNFLYASCRKFHGIGEDTLIAGDRIIEDAQMDLEKRPQALFLLGDQIYADDVADPLFPVIQSVAVHLIGHEEDLAQFNGTLNDEHFRKVIHQVNGRQFITSKLCNFTSSNAGNHLMTFGEYAAMYLLSWSPSLWESVYIPPYDEMLERNSIHLLFPGDKAEQKQSRTRYNEQTEKLLQTMAGLQNVRRLLANVPTYMIFDDHDITDDWNLSADWITQVSQSPLGKHVIANGLSAYWIFQGWGNEPQRFEEKFIKSMSHHFAGFTAHSVAYVHWVKRLWSYKDWHFVAPTKPSALFLNTRTIRQFDHLPQAVKVGWIFKESTRSPRLIGTEGWNSVSKTLFQSGWIKGDPLLIISPTPLYGMGLVESVLHSYVYPLRAIGIPVDETLDFEAWKYNGKGFSDFLTNIFNWNPSQCIILSGDVHYASAVTSHVKLNSSAMTILQFTSSPTKNKSFTGMWGFLLRSAIWLNVRKRKGKILQRHCIDSFTIVNKEQDSSCSECPIWQEKLRYLSTTSGAIVETKNNIGRLLIGDKFVQNTLLQIKGEKLKETTFEKINF